MRDFGSESATAALLEHAAWMRSLARSLVGSGADADDVVQAAWLKASKHPPGSVRSPRAWLRTVLRSVVFRAFRRSDLREQAEAGHDRPGLVESAGDVI